MQDSFLPVLLQTQPRSASSLRQRCSLSISSRPVVLFFYICDYTCVECAAWSIQAGLSPQQQLDICEKKLCGKNFSLHSTEYLCQNFKAASPINNKLSRGQIRTPNYVSRGRPKPPASFIVMLLHVLKMRMLLMDWQKSLDGIKCTMKVNHLPSAN